MPVAHLVNVGMRLSTTAQESPDGVAVVETCGRDGAGKMRYRQVSFRDLEEDTNRIAAGLQQLGVTPGTRLVLLVRPGIDFIALVFAMFKAGVVTILIDPGMGKSNLIQCLADARPEGFVAIPQAHLARVIYKRRFPRSRYLVTVGRKLFWGGTTLNKLRKTPASKFQSPQTQPEDPAAIIFTTGSTGPPKGVLYRHGNFGKQVDEIRDRYQIEPGEIDVAGFPLFALFNAAMGVTTVVPDMDFTRPADVEPRNIVDAVNDWQATQSFGSPALWNAVGRYCEETQASMQSLKRVLSAGAPVPPHVLRRIKAAIHPEGEMFTPYGATEALPVASISASEVLGETERQSKQGRGTCVGSRFPGIEWKVIEIRDDPFQTFDSVKELSRGDIGELCVSGEVVTAEYVTREDANSLHKVHHEGRLWHRMGDVGYLDEQDRFWFCGRKGHRIRTEQTQLFTVPCEALFNQHPAIYRSALVGIGPTGSQQPVLIAETWPEMQPRGSEAECDLLQELREIANSHEHLKCIRKIVLHPSLPVDIRHNSKIFREQLAEWAAEHVPLD